MIKKNKTMSTSYMFLLSLSLFSLLISSTTSLESNIHEPNVFMLPITKDPKTLQYSTTIKMGTPPKTLDLVIDLRERFLWFECDQSYNSSTYNPIQCGTKKCKVSRSTDCINCTNHPFKTGCTNNTCGVQPFNPFAGFFVSGDVGEDILSSLPTINGRGIPTNVRVPRFISSCVYPNKFGVQGFLQGLSKGKKGILGLARTPISLPTQLATRFKLDRKFTICLPSTSKTNGRGLGIGPGSLFIGGGPYITSQKDDISEFLNYTPLITNRHSTGPIFDKFPSTEYFIKVNTIKVDNNVVKFNTTLLSIDKQGNGGTKLSTVIPHTKLHTSIYKPLISAFVKKAELRKIKIAKAVSPFGACFDSRTIGKSVNGPNGLNVPIIELGLKGGVKWRIGGANSMVKVGENVLCLGFVDASLGEVGPLEASIVIGGLQLEDNLLEFDLVSSKLGFSSSLLLHEASCSHF